MHVRCDNLYNTGTDGGNILGQPMLFECMDICVLSPAHESEMRSYLVYLLIVKYLSQWFLFKFSHSISNLMALSWGVKQFLEGTVDHIIYRDYTANRRSCVYCSLASWSEGVPSYNCSANNRRCYRHRTVRIARSAYIFYPGTMRSQHRSSQTTNYLVMCTLLSKRLHSLPLTCCLRHLSFKLE